MFSNPGSKTKIGQAMGILLILRFWSGSTKTVVEFLVLVRGNFFYIIWNLIWMVLFWATAQNFLVPPPYLKIDFKSILCLFFGFKAILGHEGGTQKFWVVAQNKAIQIRFQMI